MRTSAGGKRWKLGNASSTKPGQGATEWLVIKIGYAIPAIDRAVRTRAALFNSVELGASGFAHCILAAALPNQLGYTHQRPRAPRTHAPTIGFTAVALNS
jgi:hypothetical protein